MTAAAPGYRSLEVVREGAVAEVILTGPGKGNAQGPDFWREFPELLAALDADDAVRAVILRGSGNNFCTGLDLMAMAEDFGALVVGNPGAAVRTKLLALIGRMQAAVSSVERCRKPVIAAVHGWCIGGGLDLASACDVRLCSADARFSIREVKLAIVADVGSLQRLPGIIGQGHTRELALTGDDVDAARALRIGLVNELLESPAALLAHARAMATRMAANPPLVVQGVKQVLNECQGRPVEDGLRRVALWNSAFLPSEDLGEALAAFAERRPPEFKGA